MKRKPNFKLASHKALSFLNSHEIKYFPYNLVEIIRKHPNITLLTYQEVALKSNLSFKEVLTYMGSQDGKIVYDPVKLHYMIFYNEKQPLQRIKWTLAHELGHYYLNHLTSERTSLWREELNEKDYGNLEVETNHFARDVLCPPFLVEKLPQLSPSVVSEYFKISYQAASKTVSFVKLNKTYKKRHYIPDINTLRLFKNFIVLITYGRTCTNCESFKITSKNKQYCKICGFDEVRINKKGSDVDMIYNSIVLDENSKALRCPKCDNEEVENNYCKICRAYLINKCSGMHIYENRNYDNYNDWHENEYGCGNLLEGNARFCSHCGSTSTFYEDDILSNWEDNSAEESKQPININDLPF